MNHVGTLTTHEIWTQHGVKNCCLLVYKYSQYIHDFVNTSSVHLS